MTVPHLGKREPGALTAASPGDTLYFAFGTYNDSGDSEVLTGLAVTDIEVIKNGLATVRATDSGYSLISDTGMVGDRAGLYRVSIQLFNTADDASFYASGAWYNAFIDAVTIDGKTVRFHLGSWEIGRQKVNTVELNGDTGAANWLKSTYANGFADTGLYSRIDKLAEDTGGVNINSIQGDTGAAGWLKATFLNGFNDTGINSRFDQRDTGAIATAVWAGDTGLRDHITNVDTGLTNRIGIIAFDVDTGLRAQISDVDTGLHDTIADLDTGLRGILNTTGVNVAALRGDTGAANWLKTNFAAGFADTGLYSRLDKLAEDTGGVSINAIAGDTGAAVHLAQAFAAQNTNSDTGLIANAAAVRAKTDSLTFTVAGQVDSNIQYVNDVQVAGTGDTGTNNYWRPA